MPVSKSQRWKNQATKQLAWFHRWLGIATCLIFALWFASGAVLLFKPFPSLSRADQLRLETPVDVASVRISPREALSHAEPAAGTLRLVQRGSGPVYVVGIADESVVIDARTGIRLPLLNHAAGTQLARRLFGEAAGTAPAADYDQWVVHNHFDPFRPLFRVDVGDRAGNSYYVSARTGEVVQHTDTADRAWNWVGAVLHWAYFTPLRSSFTAWDQTVWWISLVAMLVAIAGTILGVIRTLAAQRQRKPSLTFFRLKWMRWHHLLGLFASLFVLTWILSGWLSMDHGRLFSRGQASTEQLARYAGQPLTVAAAKVEFASLRQLGDAREIDISAVGGETLVTTWDRSAQPRHHAASGAPMTEAQVLGLAARGIDAAWPGGTIMAPITPGPTELYALAEGWPGSARRFVDPTGTRPDIVVDASTGHLLTVLNGSRKAYAWIYYALHTFNFPGLADHRLVRQIVVLIPLLFGFAFSVTGVVLGYQRLRKSLSKNKVTQ